MEGLTDTCESLGKGGVSYVGTGRTHGEALGPVYLDVPLPDSVDSGSESCPEHVSSDPPRKSSHRRIAFLSAADRPAAPAAWGGMREFHLLSPSAPLSELFAHLSPLIATARKHSDQVIFSVHWGPNYEWEPSDRIRRLGHWIINEGGYLVHGHSSHHVQGVEVVERSTGTPRLILYGCGDFVDDYALVEDYRNDLGALWQVQVSVTRLSSASTRATAVSLKSLHVWPTIYSNFQVNTLRAAEEDWFWARSKINLL